MGHTVWSQRIAMQSIAAELKSYGKALTKEDQEVYERVMKRAFRHVGSMTYASSIHVWAFMLLSIMLEQEKRIIELEKAMTRKEREQIKMIEAIS